jgi:DNA-binding MarR family transcriptional regulator
MSQVSGPAASEEATVRNSIEQLRTALAQMTGAERRLRSRDHSRSGELTHAHMRSLAALAREPEMTAGKLAKSAELNPASVTAMLDHLEAAGIVERHRSTQDRRVCNVALTDKGHELIDSKLATWQRVWQEHLGAFNDDEIDTAVRVVSEVTRLLDSIAARADAVARDAG